MRALGLGVVGHINWGSWVVVKFALGPLVVVLTLQGSWVVVKCALGPVVIFRTLQGILGNLTRALGPGVTVLAMVNTTWRSLRVQLPCCLGFLLSIRANSLPMISLH